MIRQLKNDSLLRKKAFIDGKWYESATKATYSIQNPANGEQLTEIFHLNAKDAQLAIDAAHNAFEGWKKRSATERASYLKRWHQLIVENEEDLALILTYEQGKPYQEALGEIRYGASFVEWFAEEARRMYGDIVPGHEADKRIMVIKQPIGVVAAITPWNFPNAMITRKVAPALAAGCTVVLKPAEDTPLSALALAYLAQEAGFPAGIFNVIPTKEPKEIGKLFCESPLVRKISFTGSTAVGKWLMKHSAEGLKKLSLELGGNAPFIVFDDADVDQAVAGAIASKFRNAGQTCVCANRIFVQDGIYEAFTKALSESMKWLKVGMGWDEGTQIGPLIHNQAMHKVERLVEDAIGRGAHVQCGGKVHELGPPFYEPTILTEVTSEMNISKEEIFGPVAALYRFKKDEEVVALANATEAGLAAYFYANDVHRIYRVAEALDYGMVGVNTGKISTTVAPFGGVKHSGFGREGSKYGMDEFTVLKYICLQVEP
jgi:succinate-semialdehyde dehydrogenase/glutarate-semialdehyde dehydrogenase